MLSVLQIAHRIAELVKKSGGRTFFVGGCVRDLHMNRESKDIDIEVHGIGFDELRRLLSTLGEVQTIGASFEILHLKHCDLDIALPAEIEINGGEKSAALRRDFAMNALMQDVLTGEVLDFFGGLDDIRNHLIRMVSPRSFVLDPLRVFRAARFAATLGFEIDRQTAECASLVSVDSLASERVMNELTLSLLKSPEPSGFFYALKRMRQLDYWFVEFDRVPVILNSAAKVRDLANEKLYFMMSALCHELDDDSSNAFLTRLTRETNLHNYVTNMRVMLAKLAIASCELDYMRIFDASLCPEDLLLLYGLISDNASCLSSYLSLYRTRMSAPHLTGRDLLSHGFTPGVELGRALRYAHDLRLKGFSKDDQLAVTLECFHYSLPTNHCLYHD